MLLFCLVLGVFSAAAFAGWRWYRRGTAQAPRGNGILVAFASQTGFAEQIARRSAAMLAQGTLPVQVRELGTLKIEDIRTAGILVVVASTYGSGEPPDSARAFARKHLRKSYAFDGLRYALLALGNRDYPNFCQFGHSLDLWLRACSAAPIFEMIEVDGDHDAVALGLWRGQLATLPGVQATDNLASAYQEWRLAERRSLNPDSPNEAYHLSFTPKEVPNLNWIPGDIAVIAPRHSPESVAEFLDEHDLPGERSVRSNGDRTDLRTALTLSEWPAQVPSAWRTGTEDLSVALRPLANREYSIASIPQSGQLDLLVRRLTLPNGKLSVASGYLTRDIPIGAEIRMLVRSNPTFHPPPHDAPIILIGAGTGFAGLRVHLQHRQAAGLKDAWLIFGERSSQSDRFYADEIAAWQRDGTLTRCDLCYSRDPDHPAYVYQLIPSASAAISRLVKKQQAAIFVCGRFEMGNAVHKALAKVLGEKRLDTMVSEGRYRRDVY